MERRILLGAEVHGTVYHDLNGVGVRDQGKGDPTNWTVYLDCDMNGVLEDAGPSALTNADCEYRISENVTIPNALIHHEETADFNSSLMLGHRPMSTSVPLSSKATRLLDHDPHQQAESWGRCIDNCRRRWTEIEPSLDNTSFDSGDEKGTLRLSLANDA